LNAELYSIFPDTIKQQLTKNGDRYMVFVHTLYTKAAKNAANGIIPIKKAPT
jgi:hypothetical protein